MVISGEDSSGTAGSVTIGLHDHYGSTRSAIGSNGGESDNHANITVISGSIDVVYHPGYTDDRYPFCSGAVIGAGLGGSIGNITVYGGEISAIIDYPERGTYTQYKSEYLVGASGNHGTCENVSFKGGTIHLENRTGGIAVDPSYNLPGTFSSYSINGDSIANAIYDQNLPDLSVEDGIESDEEGEPWDRPLAIHHGTKSNQMDRFYIEGMRTNALGIKNLDVTTQSKATSAIETIERALKYSLNVATDVGSYMARLEHTESNLEIKLLKLEYVQEAI